jgi:hypothetical protein
MKRKGKLILLEKTSLKIRHTKVIRKQRQIKRIKRIRIIRII